MKKMVGYIFFLGCFFAQALASSSQSASFRVVYSEKEVDMLCDSINSWFDDPRFFEKRRYIHSLFKNLPHLIDETNKSAGKEVVNQSFFEMIKIITAMSELAPFFEGEELGFYFSEDAYFRLGEKSYMYCIISDIFNTVGLSFGVHHVFAFQILLIVFDPCFDKNKRKNFFVSEIVLHPSGIADLRYCDSFAFASLRSSSAFKRVLKGSDSLGSTVSGASSVSAGLPN